MATLFVLLLIFFPSTSSNENCQNMLSHDDDHETKYPELRNFSSMKYTGYLIQTEYLESDSASARNFCKNINLTEVVIDTISKYRRFVADLSDSFNYLNIYAKITINVPETIESYRAIPEEQCEPPLYVIRNANYSSPLRNDAACGIIHFENNTITMEDNCNTRATPMCFHVNGSSCFSENLRHQEEGLADWKKVLDKRNGCTNPTNFGSAFLLVTVLFIVAVVLGYCTMAGCISTGIIDVESTGAGQPQPPGIPQEGPEELVQMDDVDREVGRADHEEELGENHTDVPIAVAADIPAQPPGFEPIRAAAGDVS